MADTLKGSKFPYYQAPNMMYEIGLNPYQIAVYGYLCRCSNQGSAAFPSYNTMAEKCGMSRKKTIDTVQELIIMGLLFKTVRKDDNKNNSNIYEVVHDIHQVKQVSGVQDIPPSVQDIPPSISDTPSNGVQDIPPSVQDIPNKELIINNSNINKELDIKYSSSLSLLSYWPKASSKIIEKIGNVSFNTWFITNTISEVDEYSLKIITPNDFSRHVISSRYLAIIQDAMREAAGRPVSIIVEVA
jgi:hypothetical protein